MLNRNKRHLTLIGGCILLFAGLMVSCSPSQQKEQKVSSKKTHNGVLLSEVMQPFGPNGLEKHLYEGGFDKFYSQLQTEIKTFKNNKLSSYKTNLRFWGGDVILVDKDDAIAFFAVYAEPRAVELNVHNLDSKPDLKNTLRVGLINESVNLVLFDGSGFSMEKRMQEEMLSDLAMSMCPDSSNTGWIQLVAGRLVPIVETQQFKQLDDMTIANQLGIDPPTYVRLIRVYAKELVMSLGQSAEELAEKERISGFVAMSENPDNPLGFQQTMISFWQTELTPDKLKAFKSGCQNRYQEELRKYW